MYLSPKSLTYDMMANFLRKTTPGSNQSSIANHSDATRPAESGEPNLSCGEESELPRASSKIRPKVKYLMGTLNINTLMKVGKLHHLTDVLSQRNILILALQESRYLDENAFESGGYRIYKGKPAIKNAKNISMFGTAFLVKQKFLESIINFHSPSERISFLTFKSGNKRYTIINAHAPTNQHNRTDVEQVEDFWEMLEYETSKIPTEHVKILLGDFNAQVGKERKFKPTVGEYPAHERTNRNGERLIDFCRHFNLRLMTTVFRKLARKKKTWVSPNPNQGEYQLDHVAITTRNRKEISDVRVRKGLNIESDHYLTEIKTKFQPNKPRSQPNKFSRVNIKFLTQNKEKFCTALTSRQMGDWDEIKETMIDSIREIGQPKRTPRHRWWNELCDEAIDNRLKAWQKWNSNKKNENWENFREERKKTAKILRAVKRAFDRGRLANLDSDFKRNNSSDFYKTFKDVLTGYRSPSLHFKDENGKMVLNNKDNCQLLAAYFENLLNCDEPMERLQFQEPPYENPPSEPPTLEEIVNIITSLKNNKAPGEDGIVAEMWKYGGLTAWEKVQELIADIWITGIIPHDWKVALIHPIHKKGDKTNINNYRGISLLSITYKILSTALLRRIEVQVEPTIGDYQAGFRKNRSCIEQILNLKSILKVRAMQNKNTVVLFVDFQKAYDSVDRQTLFQILYEKGIDFNTRRLVEQTLSDTASRIKFQGELSALFNVKTGVRQGDGLSPILFNLVLDKIIQTWNHALENMDISGIRMGQGKSKFTVKCLAFADDIALLTDNLTHATIMLDLLHEIAEKTGLHISYGKTEYMEHKHNDEKFLLTEYGKIKRVDKFKYLGEWIQANGLDTAANKDRIKKLTFAYKLTQNYYNKKSMSIQAKIRHYKSVIRPQATYGSESLTLNKKGELRALETKERNILRKILGPVTNSENVWIKRRNTDLYKNIESITITMRKRRLRLYGHLKRMDDSRITKKIFNYMDKLKNTIGWLVAVREDARQLGVTDEVIQDRDHFRLLVETATFVEDTPIPRQKRVWTDEQRRLVGIKMKKYWEQKKKKQQNH